MAVTLDTLVIYARNLVNTDANGLPDTLATDLGIVFANEALLDFYKRLALRGCNLIPIKFRQDTLVAGTTTYNFPADFMLLKAMEINFTDTTQSNYFPASLVDYSNLPQNSIGQGATFNWLRANQPTTSPLIAIQTVLGTATIQYEVFPTPESTFGNLTNAARYFYYQLPTLFVAKTDTPDAASLYDQTVISYKIAALYKDSIGNASDGGSFQKKYEEKVDLILKAFGIGEEKPIATAGLPFTGYEF